MSTFDKMKHQAQQWAGRAKESAGRAGDDKELRDAGKRDRMEGGAKESGQHFKDRAAGAVQDAKDRFRGRGSRH